MVFSICYPLPGLLPDIGTAVHGHFGKLNYLSAGPALRRMIRLERPDIVHAHYASGYGFLCSTWLTKGSYILSMWGSDIFVFPRDPVRRWILTRNLARASTLLSTSEAMRREAAKYTSQPIHLTPFGVDAGQFRPPSERPQDRVFRIGTARILAKKSGIDTLLEAFAAFSKSCRGRNYELLIAGDGPERSKLEQLASRYGIENNVSFLGWISHCQLPAFLQRLDIFCALSRSESFCVAALEASACGVPVIASNTEGLPETVQDGTTGFLVRRNCSEEAAKCMEMIYRDPKLGNDLGNAGRKFVVERYSWDKCVDVMERVYDSVAGGQASR